jgi:hypothetical protein
VGKQPPDPPQEAVGFCAAADLGAPVAAGGRPRRNHQVSIQVLQDLDLGALRILPEARRTPSCRRREVAFVLIRPVHRSIDAGVSLA